MKFIKQHWFGIFVNFSSPAWILTIAGIGVLGWGMWATMPW